MAVPAAYFSVTLHTSLAPTLLVSILALAGTTGVLTTLVRTLEHERSDTARFKRFFHGMLDRGVYLPPSQYEAAFLCSEHSPALIDQTLSAARATLREG